MLTNTPLIWLPLTTGSTGILIGTGKPAFFVASKPVIKKPKQIYRVLCNLSPTTQVYKDTDHLKTTQI
jgi:hypothetical protein